MDTYISNSINIRKQSIFDYYEVKDEKFLTEIEELFAEINSLGQASKDVSDFETKFASELNDKYLDLLTRIATSCPLKDVHKEQVFSDEDGKEYLKETAKDELSHLGREAYFDTRSALDSKFGIKYKIRSTPVLGQIWEVENQTSVFADLKDNFFSKKRS